MRVNGQSLVGFQSGLHDRRKGALHTIKRTVTTGRVEVIVVDDSREQFNWITQGIDLAFCLLNMSKGFVAMLSVSSHVFTKRLLSFLEVMALLFAVSITLLFVLRSGVTTQMLMVICMVYFWGYAFNAILDGVAGRGERKIPTTSWNLDGLHDR